MIRSFETYLELRGGIDGKDVMDQFRIFNVRVSISLFDCLFIFFSYFNILFYLFIYFSPCFPKKLNLRECIYFYCE